MILKPIITADLARDALDYDTSTGLFTWKYRPGRNATWNARYSGKVAGYNSPRGNVTYRAMSLENYPILSHQVAFLIMTGECPAVIDHIDGNGTNNAWANLRAADKIMNGANSRKRKNNTSGFKGVCFNKKLNKWRSSIYFHGKHIALGHHNTAEEAHAAYMLKAHELFGEFARAA